MDGFIAELKQRLARFKEEGRHRALEDPQGLDFTSNDYLGLSRHPSFSERLRRRLGDADVDALGAPGARLLRGNTSMHRHLEQRLARFKGMEDTLLFPSGYQANLAVLTALISPRDRILSDRQNHASIIDAIRLVGAKRVVFPHLDVEAIEEAAAEAHSGGRTFLITESLFSMDGDVAPLNVYARLARKYDLNLIVDDAHATGCYGEKRGSGLVEHFGVEQDCLAIVSTCGKALGLCGAFVAAPQVVTQYLVNRARPFIFTTSIAPLLLYALDIALDLQAAEPERRSKVHGLAARLRRGLEGYDCLASSGPIVPVVLGENERSLKVAAGLRGEGFDVRAVRPPTVADGTARLRLSVHADHRAEDIDQLAAALRRLVAPSPVSP